MALISAYRKDTGEKVRVPAHFFDNPILSKPFSKTPSQKAREAAAAPAPAPATTTKKEG